MDNESNTGLLSSKLHQFDTNLQIMQIKSNFIICPTVIYTISSFKDGFKKRLIIFMEFSRDGGQPPSVKIINKDPSKMF